MLLPFSPLAPLLCFVALPPLFFAVPAAMIVAYLAPIESAKYVFYKSALHALPAAPTAAPSSAAPGFGA